MILLPPRSLDHFGWYKAYVSTKREAETHCLFVIRQLFINTFVSGSLFYKKKCVFGNLNGKWVFTECEVLSQQVPTLVLIDFKWVCRSLAWLSLCYFNQTKLFIYKLYHRFWIFANVPTSTPPPCFKETRPCFCSEDIFRGQHQTPSSALLKKVNQA